MKTLEITRVRLDNQRLSSTVFETTNEVVSHLGAVQAQDYAGAKWALAQRMKDASDAAIEKAFTDGSILRTHVLRPTWHFVAPEDIRWMLKLTAPRVHAASAFMYRQSGLDKATFKKSNKALEKALRDGKQLTRTELGSALDQVGIQADGVPLGHLMMFAELEGVICSGARRGKQFTYALLDERAPQARSLTRDESLAELTLRYFTSRGPATLKDFVWWSGLTMADARKGIELIKSRLVQEMSEDQTYWLPASTPSGKTSALKAFLLPNYDEYTVGYTDRRAIFDGLHTSKLDSRGSELAQYTILVNGQIAGTWKRTIKKNEVSIEVSPFIALTKAERQAIAEAAERFGQFLGLSISLTYKEHTHEQRQTRSLQ